MADISNLTDDAGLQSVLEGIVDDLTAIRNAVTGLTAKLDADTGIEDTDYASTLNPAALTTTD